MDSWRIKATSFFFFNCVEIVIVLLIIQMQKVSLITPKLKTCFSKIYNKGRGKNATKNVQCV